MEFIESKGVSHIEEKHSPKESSLTHKIRENPWILTTIVLTILSLLLIFGNFGSGTGAVVSESEVGGMLVNFLEDQGINGLDVISVEKVNNFYKVDLGFQGQIVPFYVTKTGYLAGNSITSIIPGQYEIIDPDLGSPDSVEPVEVSEDDDAVKGDVNAPVTIIEFSDYECPFCGRYFRDTLPQIISEYVDTGKVKIVFRDFPLSFHANAQKAAEAAECAGEFGDDKYWEMHDKLFNNQNALDVDNLKQYASEIPGIDEEKFNDCLDSGRMASEVQADIDEGASYGVSGTPGFFINGRPLSGAQPFSAFKEIIDAELAKA